MSARPLAVLLVSAVALAGCGSTKLLSSTSSTATSSSGSASGSAKPSGSGTATAAAPAGTVKSADGRFATVVPRGFADNTKTVQGGTVNIQYLAIGPRSDGFATNINVVREQSQGASDIDKITSLEIAGIKRFEAKAHQFSQIQSLTVDGEPARSVDYLSQPGDRPLHQLQVFVARGAWIYTITYSALPTDYSDNVSAMAQVTSGWHWLA
ncbi:MAG TPA: DcrB-related protein [Solirubrobacteraceae bacterium]